MQRGAALRHVVSKTPTGVTARYFPIRYASSYQARATSRKPAKASPPPLTEELPPKSRALPWVVSSIFATVIGFYVVQLYVAARKPCPNPAVANLEEQKDVAGVYDNTADSFDSEVGVSEMLMGINGMRKKLAQQCKGHVLEVSCGTGRNLGYYDIWKNGQVDSLTLVDLSPQMVQVCKKKWDALVGSKKDKLKHSLVVRFLPGSALGQMPLAPTSPAPRKYDTVIQTMGICSTASPVELVSNMAQHLDFSKPDARILLLEHGRSYQQWLNNILDNSAEKHAEIHGCWFNRDIGALVEDAAAKAGLQVVKERRHHFGTTWIFELKPKLVIAEETQDTTKTEPAKSKDGRWFSFYK